MNTGKINFREAHKRSVSAGSYSGASVLHAALACRISGPLDFMYSSGGRMYPIAYSRLVGRGTGTKRYMKT